MESTVDPNIKEALSELHLKRNEYNDQTKFLKVQLETIKKNMRRTEIVATQLKSFPADIRTYASVGKMFMLTPRDQLIEELEKDFDPIQKNQDSVQNAIEQLQASVLLAEAKVRDLLEQKKKVIA